MQDPSNLQEMCGPKIQTYIPDLRRLQDTKILPFIKKLAYDTLNVFVTKKNIVKRCQPGDIFLK